MRPILRISFLIYLLIDLLGCVSKPTNRFPLEDENATTVNSDLDSYLIEKDSYYLELAKSYSLDGQTERSIDYFKQSLNFNFQNKITQMNLARLYLRNNSDHLALLQLQKINSEKINNGKINNGNKIELSENDINFINYSKANLLVKSKIFHSARNYLYLISENSPYFDKAQWLIYHTFCAQNEFLKAQEALNKIVMTEENQVELIFQRALLAKNLKNLSDYENRINEAYMLDPHNLDIVIEKKNMEISKNNFEVAYIILKRYSDTHDFNYHISIELSNLSIKLRNYEDAIVEIDKQWPWSNEQDYLNLKKAQIMFLMNDYHQSETYFMTLLERSQFKNEAQFYLAQIYMIENRWDKAKPLVDQIDVSSDYFAQAQINLAYFENSIGLSDKAINRLQSASKWKPNDLEIRFSLVNLLMSHSKYSQASNELQSTVNENSKRNEIVLKKSIELNLLRSPASQEALKP